MAAKKKTVAEAAEILGVYESEVAGVDGDVATTTDGQRYQLTGDHRGDWWWLKVPSGAPQILQGDD